jgi:hypothetical protein
MKPFVVTADRIHDARLLAVYGLYEHDAGDDGKAREFLEAAVKEVVMRPRAYVVLAGLRYSEALAKPSGQDGKFSAEQAESILDPLRTALKFAPSQDVLGLIVATWTNSEAKPADADIAVITDGAALYPRNTDLAYNSALLCAQTGHPAQAARLIDQGLVFTIHEGKRQYFEELRSTLSGPQEAASK